MTIKKYNDFVKTNEEFVLGAPAPTTRPVVKPTKTPTIAPSRPGTKPAPPSVIPDEGQSDQPAPAKAEMEEEGGNIYSQKLQELANQLGVDYNKEDNFIQYNGHKIMFPSETEKYQIEGVKGGFNTVEEVMVELEKHSETEEKMMDIDEDEFEKGDVAFESKSYRNLRKRK